MFAKRLPLVWAFAGGCLSGAALLGLWLGSTRAASPVKHRGAERAGVGWSEPSVPVPGPAYPDEVARPSVEAQRGVVAASVVAVSAARPEETAKGRDDAEPASDTGRSVADILADLEAAYRQGLKAPSTTTAAVSIPALVPATAPSTAVSATAAPTAIVIVNVTTPAPVAAAAPPPNGDAPAAPAPAAVAAPVAAAAPAVAAPVATPAPAPIAAAPAPVPAAAPVSEVATGPGPSGTPPGVARDASFHVGNVHQGGNVVYGDVYQGNVIQAQQLAILQYMQVIALSPYARYGGQPTYTPRGVTRRSPAFSTSLTNPDNPWGYDFPPTVLAK